MSDKYMITINESFRSCVCIYIYLYLYIFISKLSNEAFFLLLLIIIIMLYISDYSWKKIDNRYLPLNVSLARSINKLIVLLFEDSLTSICFVENHGVYLNNLKFNINIVHFKLLSLRIIIIYRKLISRFNCSIHNKLIPVSIEKFIYSYVICCHD